MRERERERESGRDGEKRKGRIKIEDIVHGINNIGTIKNMLSINQKP